MLLDTPLATSAPPALLALSALSLSLDTFSRPAWPPALAALSVYGLEDCAATKAALVKLQVRGEGGEGKAVGRVERRGCCVWIGGGRGGGGWSSCR